jgi:hypothetical protein
VKWVEKELYSWRESPCKILEEQGKVLLLFFAAAAENLPHVVNFIPRSISYTAE